MSMIESVEAEIAYKCDLCGELFSSPEGAQNHNQKVHPKPESKDEMASSNMGTSTPAEDKEEESAG
jgi:hypothetical protein